MFCLFKYLTNKLRVKEIRSFFSLKENQVSCDIKGGKKVLLFTYNSLCYCKGITSYFWEKHNRDQSFYDSHINWPSEWHRKCPGEALLELLPVHSPDKMNEAEGNGRMLDRFRSTSHVASIVRSNRFEPLVFKQTHIWTAARIKQNPAKKQQNSDKKRGNRFLNNTHRIFFSNKNHEQVGITLSPSDLALADGFRKTTGWASAWVGRLHTSAGGFFIFFFFL